MKQIWQLLASIWTVAFLAFFAATICRRTGRNVPNELERFRELFERGLKSFLPSGMVGVVFILGWLALSYHLGKKSGWSELKEKFRYKKDIKDIKYCAGSGEFSKGGYHVRIGLCKDGIIVKEYILLFHPALFFPWSQISNLTLYQPQKSIFNILEQNLRAKISRETFVAQTAEISFRDYHDMKIRFPWRQSYHLFLPKDLIVLGMSKDSLQETADSYQ